LIQINALRIFFIVSTCLLLSGIAGCNLQKSTIVPPTQSSTNIAVIEATNPSNFERTQEPLFFSFYALGLTADDARIKFLVAEENGRKITSQIIDTDNDGKADTLLVTADFKPAQIRKLMIVSDANIKRPAPTKQPLDVLRIENTAAATRLGFWNEGAVNFVSNGGVKNTAVMENSALYSNIYINYNPWRIDHHSFDVSTSLSISSGSRLIHTRSRINETNFNETNIAETQHPRTALMKDLPNIAVSLVKHSNTTLIIGNDDITGSAWTYTASWETQNSTDKKNHFGAAIIFRKGDLQQRTENENLYISIMNTNGGEVDYYSVTTSDQALKAIKTETDFKAYLDHQVERLTKETRIKIESSLSARAKQKPMNADTALTWSRSLADSELMRKTLNYHANGWDEFRQRPTNFEYDVVGMQINALQQLDKIMPDARYRNALQSVTGSYITPEGKIIGFTPDLYSIDRTKAGEMVILLEERTKDVKYRRAVDLLRANLKRHPRTSEGALWHRITYPNQLWLDGVYMGMPFLAQYAATYETGTTQHNSFEEAVHEFVVARNHLRDSNTGLYYHAWDESKTAEWADKITGRSPQYWSRGMGWYAMALVDVLDYLPNRETELRKTLIDIINELAPTLLHYQDETTGTWWQIIDRPGDIGNYRESTATAMFSYFLTKSINQGYLPKSYSMAAVKTYTGLVNEFISVHPDGKISMNGQCLVAGLGFGRNGSYDYYLTEPITANDPKGNTPFILAGIEMYKLLKQ